MLQIGLDIGTAFVRLAMLEGGSVVSLWEKRHRGRLLPVALEALSQIRSEKVLLAVTGSNAPVITDPLELSPAGEIPAIAEGTRFLVPEAGSIIEIGSQNSRFLTELTHKAPRFSVNEHCAGGTGSFFEDQMSRLGLDIEDYSPLVAKAQSIPRLSGRCSVFAKTDIIHRQQEGVPTPDILLGLCYAMVRNYKAVIVRNLPVHKPVVFCGGVTRNQGVRQAIESVFDLEPGELIIPEQAPYAAAIGAARMAEEAVCPQALVRKLLGLPPLAATAPSLPPLDLRPGSMQPEPKGTGVIPPEGCALGIDIGSTSTDLVLVGKDGTLIHHQYLRTAGDPEAAVRRGLDEIRKVFGSLTYLSTGITGSGRDRLGKRMGVDAIRDEITAQARAAAALAPDTDTVFEIGGQDSKFISLKDGEVADFQMNKICAAGTGSFIEEQAARMGIPLDRFGEMAVSASRPCPLGERCTVFMETAIDSAAAEGVSQENIAAGLCHAIVRNYLHKVVGSKPVGKHIVLQGGVAYNPGIVAAFQSFWGDALTVSPYFPISGAYGAALLALDQADGRPSTFHGLDAAPVSAAGTQMQQEIKNNQAFYQRSARLLLADYDGTRDPRRKTVGIPFVLMIHKFFPLANAFFKALGYNVLLTKPTDEETIRLSQQYAQGETCYPVKLIYGHMAQLMEAKVDYIFLPSIRTMKHESSKVANNYGCVYMQTAPRSVARALQLEEKGITLLNPVFDLDFGKKAMASAMIGLGMQLGKPKPFCLRALMMGANAVRKHTEAVEKQGKAILSNLQPQDKVLVLITRNYGLSDPILNMGIPDLLLERGMKIMTLSHLPAHDLDLSQDYPGLYWPFGQHIISGIKLVAHHPNLYAVCLSNHGCGPDSMLSHMVRTEMGDKPYLQIEVDEHFSKVGVITRVEAFLNSLSHRPVETLPADFDLKAVSAEPVAMTESPDKALPLYLPPLGCYTEALGSLCEVQGIQARPMVWAGVRNLSLGRAETSAKEYLPFPALLDSALRTAQATEGPIQLLIPAAEGAEADGLYARSIRSVLDRMGLQRVQLVSPMLETLPETFPDPDLLCRSLLGADLRYAAPPDLRDRFTGVPTWETLRDWAAEIGSVPVSGHLLGAAGTPMCLTSLDDDILSTLDAEGNTVLRAPLTEALWFLWRDKLDSTSFLDALADRMADLHRLLGSRSPFALDVRLLRREADRALPRFAGGNGRYRWTKAVELSGHCQAVLTLAPRYENTAAVLDMRGLGEACQAPVFQIALDGDWEESSWSRLRSFLYYC